MKKNKAKKKTAMSAILRSEKELFDFYSEGHDVLPMPTLVDALSNQKDEGQYSEIEKTFWTVSKRILKKFVKRTV